MDQSASANVVRRAIEWGGRTLSVEFGKLARQATASATVRYGDTVVLATAVMSPSAREGMEYFPLTVDYEERFYAAGKIKGSRFIKREGRPADEAVLSARLVDRSIRPLFDDRMRNDIQVVLTILSFDGKNDADIPSLVAASLILSISPIPWAGPIAGLRVGRVNGEFVMNPTYDELAESELDLVVAGTAEKVTMLEAGAKEISEALFYEAITFGQQQLTPVLNLITEITQQYGQKKINVDELLEEALVLEPEVIEKVRSWATTQLRERFFGDAQATKHDRKAVLATIKQELDAWLIEDQVGKERRQVAFSLFDELVEDEVTRAILDEGRRVDGRALTEIRPLSAEVGILPRTHGSGLFSRGETQVLSVVTLGSPGEEQLLDTMETNSKKRYMHYYNFPPFSVGEAGRMMGPKRREIGHGALAEKALIPVLPTKEDFPYTILAVSEVLGSNGSSSMGSVCGSTLCLMDAGVPITSPVAGVAMGLASDDKGRYKILTDLQDLEDGKGGMDFKVAGSEKGITAVQMDTKTYGLTQAIVKETLTAAREGRMRILDVIHTAIKEPRSEMSPFAPRIVTLNINPERIRDLIGPGGKVINEIIDKTGVTIDVEQDGKVNICSANADGLDRAVNWVKQLTREVEVGELYDGKVTRLMDFGAFVEILPKKEGLVHISELAPYRVNKVSDVVKVRQEVKVKVIEIDELGRVNLSMRQAMPADAFPPAPAGGDQQRGNDRPHDSSQR
ncbi:polyribonucleotide nucleotidyltransferase [Candidatus Uhrbacteria bacterium CG10_big_fil_rev_8_21_14_0_10_48_11]|uniref:Polyribonucleotide nucleotidyltransferase n=1 Tax=Candidatus Uhrbacteria bacterium CG10_big_fil_rev_8_21_14_0_10_48_11 TaxID=1975037 RepID=A0A2M8LDR2_9BACT|nr:MAG: polyribonucleotide nucleotidyltransferase [Candidatus Uhrbacteria bacterium CG10_big_fil_rev_8_21_14_0_10_48_11]